jgi:hypothetical protein
MVIAAIFATLTLTPEAFAAEPPFPWELPPEQLGPLLKEQYIKAESQEKFESHFIRPGEFGNEILCVSDPDLVKWRDGSPKIREKLATLGKCIRDPVGWYFAGFGKRETRNGFFAHSSYWLIDPEGTKKKRFWTLAAVNDWTKPSCEEEVGLEQAKKYRKQCLQVSTATHPPCGIQNTCAPIIEHIDYMCHRLRENVDTDESWRKTFETRVQSNAKFCDKYVPDWWSK